MRYITAKALSILLLATASTTSYAITHSLPRHHVTSWCNMALEDYSDTDICIPVVFINFELGNGDNETEITERAQKSWLKKLNDSDSANHLGDAGSVSDYFLAQSYGALNVTFESIGTYMATGRASDYQEYSASNLLMHDAIRFLDLEGDDDGNAIDWSRYDSNGDGEVDCVLAIYAGHADDDLNRGHFAVSSIYPHRSWMTYYGGTAETVGDGQYRVQSYVMCNNLVDGGVSISPSHCAIHELSHGILDLVDYYAKEVSYLGQWDVMCFGYRQLGWSSTDNHCCDMTSFNRMYMGWLTPIELNEPAHIRLQPLSQEPQACVIFDPADDRHFYLLENRAKLADSWDYHLPAEGLLLTEINWSQDAYDHHSVNRNSPRNIRVIDASTSKGLAIHNDIYYDYSQADVTYGPDGRNEIPSTVNSLFSTHTVTNITINPDHSVEFDYMGGDSGICDIAQDSDTMLPTYNLMGQRMEGDLRQGQILLSNNHKIILYN